MLANCVAAYVVSQPGGDCAPMLSQLISSLDSIS